MNESYRICVNFEEKNNFKLNCRKEQIYKNELYGYCLFSLFAQINKHKVKTIFVLVN